MDARKAAQLEALLGRELSADEKDRLRRIKDVLQISDNDALWDLLVAMEYQKAYYEDLPNKVTCAAAKICAEVSAVAEKKFAFTYDSIKTYSVEQAKKLSTKAYFDSWLPWSVMGLVTALVYGSLMLLAGHCIGSGQTQPPLLLLRMPVGVVLGGLCLSGGLFMGFLAAKGFSERKTGWRKQVMASLSGTCIGGIILVLSI